MRYSKHLKSKHFKSGFSLIELLVVIAIIGMLAGIVIYATNGARQKGRDARRKADLYQIGRFIAGSECYLPNAGAGDYDLADLAAELKIKYPQFVNFIASVPQDPKTGSGTQTNYRYLVTASNACVLYANLENQGETANLTSLTAPTAGGGTGILRASSTGPNGSNVYYQIGK